MKYSNKQYARALVEALAEEKDEVVRKNIVGNFLYLLRRHGRSSQLRFIVQAAESEYDAVQGMRRVEIFSASPLSRGTVADIKAALGNGKIAIHEYVDPAVLGGVRILVDGETLIDATARRQLDRLFNL